jgi:hypothetical protein
MLAAMIFTMAQGSVSAQTAWSSLPADYEGMVGPLRVILHLRQMARTGVTGTIDSIDQEDFGLRCTDITESEMKFSFTVPEVRGSYKGDINSDGNTITGIWTQKESVPLVFTRKTGTDAASLKTDAKNRIFGRSPSLHFGPNGKLVYARTSKGDRIPDFSSAGYRGGGIVLPHVTTRVKLSPSGEADDTPVIQAALDKVAKLPLRARGERGAVELGVGTFHMAGMLAMHVSGVVLRGAGDSGANATILEMTGAPHLAIEMKGELRQQQLGGGTHVTDRYVPAGATVIHVVDASEIHAGDTIQITKPVTPQWTHFMGMDHLFRDGKPEKWVQHNIRVRRRVASVSGNTLRLQVPLTDSFDAQFYPGVQPDVRRLQVTGQIAQTGVENLRIVAPDRSINLRVDPEFDGIVMDNVVDSWLRSVAFQDTTSSVRIDQGAERLTVVDVDVTLHSIVTSRAHPGQFSVQGSQILLDRCTGQGDKVSYVETQSHSEGPVVVLHCRFLGDGTIEGHQRWTTGLLVDSCAVPDGSINLRNRGIMGTGHGWASGWSVLWNNEAEAFLVQNPPGDLNWSIGNVGEHVSQPMPAGDESVGPPLPGGVVESMGTHVKPASLYLQQLRERMGPAALAAIGY